MGAFAARGRGDRAARDSDVISCGGTVRAFSADGCIDRSRRDLGMVFLHETTGALCALEVRDIAARSFRRVARGFAREGLAADGIRRRAGLYLDGVARRRTACRLRVPRDGVRDIRSRRLERELVLERLARRAEGGLAAEDIGMSRIVNLDARILPLVGGKVERSRRRDGIVVRLVGVLDIAPAAAAAARRIAGEVQRAAVHLDQMRCLFHRVSKPAGDDRRGRLLDAAMGESGVLRERQDVVAVGNVAVDLELDLCEVRDAARRDALGVDVQHVARRIRRAAAAVDDARDSRAGGDRIRAVAEAHGVVRRLACAARVARIDIAADRAARDGDPVARRAARRARLGERTAVEAARHRAAREGDHVLRRIAAERADICAVCLGDACAGV